MNHLRPAIVLIVFFTLLTGFVLPTALTEAAMAVLPGPAGGSLVMRDGKVVGSTLIGQLFAADKYFQGRPSATTDTDPADDTKQVPAPYNGGSSNASNAGPTSKTLIDRVTGDVVKAGPAPVPGDSVTTSASGLDPHISPENAARQVARVAQARQVPEDKIRTLLAQHIEGRLLGLIGEPRVNVLELNLALDAM